MALLYRGQASFSAEGIEGQCSQTCDLRSSGGGTSSYDQLQTGCEAVRNRLLVV